MEAVNVSLELFGIVISLLLLICCFAERNKSAGQTGLFMAMLSINILVLLCDMLTWLLPEQSNAAPLLYICNFLVYSLGYVLTAVFTHFLFSYIAQRRRTPDWIVYVIDALCALAVGLVAVSLINQMYFRFENGVYIRGSMYWLSQVYPIGILLVDMAVILWCRRSLGLKDTLSLLSYELLPLLSMLIQVMVYGVTLLYLATTVSLLIIYLMVHVEQMQRLQEKELEVAQANTAIMLSQIQPHFLYNTLTAIAALCEVDAHRAKETTIAFSRYLRCNMDSLKQRQLVSFQKEWEHTKTYLDIEQLRFGERLKVKTDIQETGFLLPPLTIQPIVENAVKHGICVQDGGGTVTISTQELSDCYMVVVQDDGVGMSGKPMDDTPTDNRTHIGIDNVRRRLDILCGGRLNIQSEAGLGTTVTICLPKDGKGRL